MHEDEELSRNLRSRRDEIDIFLIQMYTTFGVLILLAFWPLLLAALFVPLAVYYLHRMRRSHARPF